MGKLSALPTETTFALSDFIPKIKAAGAGDNKVTLQDFLTAIGMFYQELGRTTLAVAGDNIVVNFTAKKYLKILCIGIPSGSLDTYFQFNSDTGANYAHRKSDNGAADGTVASQTSIDTLTGAVAQLLHVEIQVINIAAQEKLVIGHSVIANTAGAANIPTRKEFASKWANTSAQINSVKFFNSSTGDFAIGSEVVVLGHD